MAWTKIQSGSKGEELVLTMSEEAANDSSKELLFSDLGVGHQAELLAIRVELTTTATVGTRTMEVRIEDEADDDVLYQVILVANTLAAGLSETWQVAPGLDETQTAPQYVQMPPNLYLFDGQKLVIEDSAAIDAAADDMLLHVMCKVRSRVR